MKRIWIGDQFETPAPRSRVLREVPERDRREPWVRETLSARALRAEPALGLRLPAVRARAAPATRVRLGEPGLPIAVIRHLPRTSQLTILSSFSLTPLFNHVNMFVLSCRDKYVQGFGNSFSGLVFAGASFSFYYPFFLIMSSI